MGLPATLERIVEDFADAPADLRVEMLFEFSEKVATLPPDLEGAREAMERVVECQTPFFLSCAVRPDGTVAIWFDCPPEAPTTRGFAGILSEGLRGARPEDILGVPDDFYMGMGLGEAISPLRLRGMSAILRRLKRQVRARVIA
ncbi:MAG: SufE family protein [Nitriliruptorales bacterium]|nr:SufE family protein [Nitriliruptorales bacterium]